MKYGATKKEWLLDRWYQKLIYLLGWFEFGVLSLIIVGEFILWITA